MKYLLFLIPSIALANFISGPQSPAYANKKVCEKKEQARCYFVPPEKREFRSVGRIEDVEIDDPSKPIYEFEEPTEFCEEPPIGLDPVEKPKEKQECKLVCPEEFEHIIERDEIVNCRKTVGFEKMTVKEFRIPKAAKLAKLQERAQKEQQEVSRRQACEDFKALVADSAINKQSRPQDVQEVVRRLLGIERNCR
jgi:hypothetical protein